MGALEKREYGKRIILVPTLTKNRQIRGKHEAEVQKTVQIRTDAFQRTKVQKAG